jgi:hypothetical protein
MKVDRSDLDIRSFHSKVDHCQVGFFLVKEITHSQNKNFSSHPIIPRDRNNTKKQVSCLSLLFLKIGEIIMKILL